MTLKKELKKVSEDYNTELQILYDTNNDINCCYVRISDTSLYGEDGYFITSRIDIYLTSNIRVASITIPTFLGYLTAYDIYNRLKLLDVHIFTPPDGEYNPKKWMRKTYPYDQGIENTIYSHWVLND